MTKAARTVWVFGIYLMLEGVFLMMAPASMLHAIGIPDPNSVWRIVLGFVVAVLGYYYIRNGKENLRPFFTFTVQIRLLQLGFFVWLYFFERGTMALVLFSVVEAIAGVWTWHALKKS
ncbi:MAG: hypothetical protein RIF46_12190 [Cyclobacteriaceae bacterium]